MTWRFSYISAIRHTLPLHGFRLGMSLLSLVVLAFILQPVLVGQAAGQAGTVDPTFNVGSGANNTVRSVASQSDDKVIIGGQFTSYNGTGVNRIARLNNDGTLDTTFNVGSGANNPVNSIAIQSDGKVIIGGVFTTYNGIGRNYIARLNDDGTLDTTFNVGSGATRDVFSVAIQSDGKVIIGGSFTSYNGTEVNRIARLNDDGSLDTSFNVGSGANSIVLSVAIQSDGKVIIGGFLTSYNGTGVNRIARLNTDGTLDTTFNVGGSGANSFVQSVVIQSDGKVIIGGSFTSYNSTGVNRIARLNTDGSLDTTFNVGSGANNTVTSVASQSDGKVIIGGGFTTYNAIGRNYIARLNTDGSLDTTFNVGTGANDGVQSVAIQSGGKIIIGGLFTSVDTYTRDRVARLEGLTKPASSLSLVSSPNPSQYGQSVTFTAITTPLTATGTVQFTFGTGGSSTSVTSTLVSGVATYVTSTLPIGDTSVTATYRGNSTLASSTSPVYTQTVTKIATNVTVTSSPNPATYGQTATFTATIQPIAATGVVTFTFNGLTQTSRPVVNGIATYITNTLAVGTYTVTATYSGDVSHAESSSLPYSQIVACNPQLVTSISDDGQATTCGTFSFALATTTQGAITFALAGGGGGNTITFTGSLTPILKAGVTIDGGDGAGGIVLNGNGVAGDGLRLGGNNMLSNLTIRNFGGRELLANVASAANQLFRVKVQN